MWQHQTRLLPTHAISCFHVPIPLEWPYTFRPVLSAWSEPCHPKPAQTWTPPLPTTSVSHLLDPHHPLRPVSQRRRGVLHANRHQPSDQCNVSDLQGGKEEEARHPVVVFFLLVCCWTAAGWGGAAAGGGAGAAQGLGLGSQEAGGRWSWWQLHGGQRNCLLPEP